MATYAKTSFKFKKLPQADLYSFGKTVSAQMSASSSFNLLRPTVDSELKPAVSSFGLLLEEAHTGNHAKVAEKNAAKTALLKVLGELASGVNMVAKGEAAIIREAGFDVQKPRHRHQGDIGPVLNFTAERTPNPNEAICKWDRTPFADKYALEYSADSGAHWHNGTYASGLKITMHHLPGRQEIMFRACALGTGGKKGPWCDPVLLFIV